MPGPDVAAYYRRRAEGGVGLIVTEGTCMPHAAAGFDPHVSRLYGDEALAGWRRVVDEVHHAGGICNSQKFTNVDLSGVTIDDANIDGLKIFGHDILALIRAELRRSNSN